MFDIDGTLLESFQVDSECFVDAVRQVTGQSIDSDWSRYQHVTDSGILREFLASNDFSEQAPAIDRQIDQQPIKAQIKRQFVKNLKVAMAKSAVKPIAGAAKLINHLNASEEFAISIATGGWRESAQLKLESAGIDYADIPIATADDHYSRIEIMKIAAQKASADQYPCSYFGDGEWDKAACTELGFRFVLVGNRISHQPQLENFKSIEKVLAAALGKS